MTKTHCLGVALGAVVAVAVAQGARDGDEEQGVVLDGGHRVVFPAQLADGGRIAFVGLVDMLAGDIAQACGPARRQFIAECNRLDGGAHGEIAK